MGYNSVNQVYIERVRSSSHPAAIQQTPPHIMLRYYCNELEKWTYEGFEDNATGIQKAVDRAKEVLLQLSM